MEGIQHYLDDSVAGKEKLEIGKARKLAAEYAANYIEVLKRDYQSAHRDVTEHQKKENPRHG